MARIRTIKPEFFRHESLFEAEKQSGLPLRVAFAGLWTAADREGRFRWSARALKLDCLPYDDVDFSRVLDALWTGGFIVKYAVDGREFGVIPSWAEHQVINNRERESLIEKPNENNILTRGARVDDATATPLSKFTGEGKGREGKGRSLVGSQDATTTAQFEEFWQIKPRRKGDNPKAACLKAFNKAIKAGAKAEDIIAAARRWAASIPHDRVGTEFVPMAVTWLNQQRWDSYLPPTNGAQSGHGTGPPDWEAAIRCLKRIGRWPRGLPGGPPGHVSCEVPHDILRKHGFEPMLPVKTEMIIHGPTTEKPDGEGQADRNLSPAA